MPGGVCGVTTTLCELVQPEVMLFEKVSCSSYTGAHDPWSALAFDSVPFPGNLLQRRGDRFPFLMADEQVPIVESFLFLV